MIILSHANRESLSAVDGKSCVLIKTELGPAAIIKMDAHYAKYTRWTGTSIAMRAELHMPPTAAVFKFIIDFRSPIIIPPITVEALLNPASTSEREILVALQEYTHLDLYIFDLQLNAVTTQRIEWSLQSAITMEKTLWFADTHNLSIPVSQYNYEAAHKKVAGYE